MKSKKSEKNSGKERHCNKVALVMLNLNVTQTLFQTADFILVALIHRYSFRENITQKGSAIPQ